MQVSTNITNRYVMRAGVLCSVYTNCNAYFRGWHLKTNLLRLLPTAVALALFESTQHQYMLWVGCEIALIHCRYIVNLIPIGISPLSRNCNGYRPPL